MNISVEFGNIIEADTEVIVNAWNRNFIPWFLLIPVGVAGAIKKAAGISPFNELLFKGPMKTGSAVMTGSGRLPYKAVIHVAGINLLWMASEQSIRSSVTSAMNIVREHQFGSVAFPVIGGSTGGFSEQRALDIMLDQLKNEAGDVTVKIVRFEKNKL